MQLLEVSSVQQTTQTEDRLQNVLKDIVKNVEIKSNFCIQHPNYKPFELPDDVVSRFQSLPTEIRNKYIGLILRSFLYGVYYNGSMKNSLESEEENKLQLDLENNTFLGIDVDFYEKIHESNQGEGYFDADWQIVKEENDGSLVVTKGGLKVHIDRDKYLQTSQKKSAIGDLVEIKMPKNLVQNGFYMAVSNSGVQSYGNSENNLTTVRIYFNLTPEGTITVMKNLTQQLNEKAIPFSFKVLYNPDEYKRYDSGVLYFNRENYEPVSSVLKNVYSQTKLEFKPEVPLFTKQLALGLGLAEEPDKKFSIQESFGMNRCQIIANGLLKAWHQGNNSPENRMNAILEQFNLLGIDVKHPYLNANSDDIYHF
ncbi:T3SS effector HopA1 family protein [Dapis sp. BLCC M126]|uniref:T3SS effector HopA1 family protein n=1 Tax=Dapis sp. BLCC M126 TaxID=3400189 RepID=UPI003CE71A33